MQGMVCGGVAAMRDAEAWLASSDFRGEIEVHRTEYSARDLTILDILPLACSKAEALRRLAAGRGIQSEEILALGDNWNDLEMLEFAGRAVVMRNGAPDLVALAARREWEIASGNDEDGVAQALESLLSGQGVESKQTSVRSATSEPEAANALVGERVSE